MVLKYIIIDSPGGGLGNLLFQYCCGYATAKKYNAQLIIKSDPQLSSEDTQRPPFIFYKILLNNARFCSSQELQELCSGLTGMYYNEPGEPKMYYEMPVFHTEVVYIKGFFQSYKYYNEYIEDIAKSFKINEETLYNNMKIKYNELISSDTFSTKTVCCHLRRGDYFKYGTFYSILSESYYEKALNNFDSKNVKILVFIENSDEIREWNIWKKYNVCFVNEPDALATLFLMSLCDHFIIANSSLSLQAYFINSNYSNVEQKLIAPSEWFGVTGPKYIMNDIVPPKAIII
jgi:hypothetical protein